MLINEFHNSLRSLLNIGQGQYFPPEDIDLHINNAVLAMYGEDYKHFEATQEITDTLGYYKTESAPLPIVDGFIELPANFNYLTAIEAVMTDGSKASVEELKDSEFLTRKHSTAFAPSIIYPTGRQVGLKKIEALPLPVAASEGVPAVVGIASIIIYYLRKPQKAIYGYTPNAGGTGWVYDVGKSIQVDYPETKHNKIQDKAQLLLGIALRDNTLISGENIRKKGNQDK